MRKKDCENPVLTKVPLREETTLPPPPPPPPPLTNGEIMEVKPICHQLQFAETVFSNIVPLFSLDGDACATVPCLKEEAANFKRKTKFYYSEDSDASSDESFENERDNTEISEDDIREIEQQHFQNGFNFSKDFLNECSN